jgi:hypothetical protein
VRQVEELFYTVFFISCVGAWFTHVITCLTDSLWGFLIAGAILFPVAIIHGFIIWFSPYGLIAMIAIFFLCLGFFKLINCFVER